jgi:murein DD-endopeptidase MepM/ murein hydrolase activator NlpD
MPTTRLLPILGFITLLLASCNTQYPETCPSGTPVGLLDADEIAHDDSLPFRFPLDESTMDYDRFFGWFGVSNECPPGMKDCYEYPIRQFHAAEDYKRPAGTPAYAMADGRISFSGPAGGYGWLIIIDHPQANLYSLYGHLSPSRWKQESGTDVKRGDLIAYLGDPDENGGSAESPLEPHLHFGIRAGQTADYPSRGEWRWMAGWIRLCPQDLGWLQPSLVITSQEIPVGGYPQPEVPLLARWGLELLITGAYGICGAGMLAGAVRKKLRSFLVFPGILLIAAGIVLHNNRMLSTYVLLAIGILLLAFGILLNIRQTHGIERYERTSRP